MKKQLALFITFMMLISTMCGFSVSAQETATPDPSDGFTTDTEVTVPDAGTVPDEGVVPGEGVIPDEGTDTEEGTDPVVEEFTITFKDFFDDSEITTVTKEKDTEITEADYPAFPEREGVSYYWETKAPFALTGDMTIYAIDDQYEIVFVDSVTDGTIKTANVKNGDDIDATVYPAEGDELYPAYDFYWSVAPGFVMSESNTADRQTMTIYAMPITQITEAEGGMIQFEDFAKEFVDAAPNVYTNEDAMLDGASIGTISFIHFDTNERTAPITLTRPINVETGGMYTFEMVSSCYSLVEFYLDDAEVPFWTMSKTNGVSMETMVANNSPYFGIDWHAAKKFTFEAYLPAGAHSIKMLLPLRQAEAKKDGTGYVMDVCGAFDYLKISDCVPGDAPEVVLPDPDEDAVAKDKVTRIELEDEKYVSLLEVPLDDGTVKKANVTANEHKLYSGDGYLSIDTPYDPHLATNTVRPANSTHIFTIPVTVKESGYYSVATVCTNWCLRKIYFNGDEANDLYPTAEKTNLKKTSEADGTTVAYFATWNGGGATELKNIVYLEAGENTLNYVLGLRGGENEDGTNTFEIAEYFDYVEFAAATAEEAGIPVVKAEGETTIEFEDYKSAVSIPMTDGSTSGADVRESADASAGKYLNIDTADTLVPENRYFDLMIPIEVEADGLYDFSFVKAAGVSTTELYIDDDSEISRMALTTTMDESKNEEGKFAHFNSTWARAELNKGVAYLEAGSHNLRFRIHCRSTANYTDVAVLLDYLTIAPTAPVKVEGTTLTATVLFDLPVEGTVMLAAYCDGKMVGVAAQEGLGENVISITAEGIESDVTDVKVMAWNDLTSLVPQLAPVVVTNTANGWVID